MSNIAAIILAAGSSSRLGQPKQMVEYLGERLLDRAVRITRQANVQKIYVVLGANAEQIEATCDLSGTQILFNQDWASGMASSIRCGMDALSETTQQAVILTCDQPAANADHLVALMTLASSKNATAASTYAGRIGTPAVFSERDFPDLRRLEGDTGARALLQSAGVATLPLVDGEFDVDTPEDLASLEY